MKHTLIYPAGSTEACRYASLQLHQLGFPLTDHPTPEITHLLLDVPSFRPDGHFRSGEDPEQLLSMLPRYITVAGGNLNHPSLKDYPTIDFLSDAYYLAQNAAITADCALKVAYPLLKTCWSDTPTLILGWGRIGKCLVRLLKGIGCPVTVVVRRESDRVILQALGLHAIAFDELPHLSQPFRLLFNTVPAPLPDMPEMESCIRIELASQSGLTGNEVVIARGLPGAYTPESSGRLIAETFYRLWKENSR